VSIQVVPVSLYLSETTNKTIDTTLSCNLNTTQILLIYFKVSSCHNSIQVTRHHKSRSSVLAEKHSVVLCSTAVLYSSKYKTQWSWNVIKSHVMSWSVMIKHFTLATICSHSGLPHGDGRKMAKFRYE